MDNILTTELNNFKLLYPNIEFYFFEEIDSTNNFCKSLANKGFDKPTLVLSDKQICGRGTKGRNWLSPKNKGLWFSLLLKPDFSTKFLSITPILTATAIYETLLEFDIKATIKWPNDIFIKDRKLGGILTESNISNEKIDYLIIGIGININLDITDFDLELQNKATSLKIAYGNDFNRFKILNTFIKKFSNIYSDITEDKIISILKIYKANSCILNKEVSLHYNNTYEIVTPIDIANDGSLLVKDSNNIIKQIYSGEVSLRF